MSRFIRFWIRLRALDSGDRVNSTFLRITRRSCMLTATNFADAQATSGLEQATQAKD